MTERREKGDDVKEVFHQERNDCYNHRLEEIEKKVRTLFVILLGFLIGHFLGPLLFG